MASGGKIRPAIRNLVRQRAGGLCEYCHTLERWQYVPFTVDHVIPLSKGGTADLDNLALSCFHCNRRKADRLVAVDTVSGEEVSLYNPREDNWRKHFVWSDDGLRIVGMTAVGRATAGWHSHSPWNRAHLTVFSRKGGISYGNPNWRNQHLSPTHRAGPDRPGGRVDPLPLC